MKIKLNIVAVILLVLLFTIASDLFSYPNGISGRTRKTTSAGCSTCHNSGTTVLGIFTGPDTVTAGQTYTFTLTLTSSSGTGKYGVDIAVKNGTLSVIAGQGLKLLSDELVHSAAITYITPKAITFSYTAPAAAGFDTLYATIVRGYAGIWNWVPNKGVVIKLPTGIVRNEVPDNFYLSQNFPNPFNPITKINYGLAKSSDVRLSVYDLLGREVAVLVNEFKTPGNYFAVFDAERYSTGIYYYRLDAGNFVEIKKMSLIK